MEQNNSPRNDDTYSLRGLRNFINEPDTRNITIIAIAAAICLTLCNYYSTGRNSNVVFKWYTENFQYFFGPDTLHRQVFWGIAVTLCYFIIPVLVVKLVLRDKLSNYGITTKGLFKGIKIYLLLYGIMLPLVVFFSFNEHFQDTYPFYKAQDGQFAMQRFLIWELVYFMQFLGVEFFFRGFVLHGFKKQMGILSIAAMMLPYVMIHFGKPMPETFGSIIAGFVLGWLSYKSNNIFPGMLLHISVAFTMDFLALWHKGLLF